MSAIKTTLNDQSSNRLNFREVHWFSYGQSLEFDFESGESILVSHPDEVWCRYTYSDMEPWKKVSCKKPSCPSTIYIDEVPEGYSAPVTIKPAKLQDLQKLSKRLPPEKRSFYDNLMVPQSTPHDHDESDDSEEDIYLEDKEDDDQ